MTEQKVSTRYARALLDITEESAITDKILQDLDMIKRMINSSKELDNLIHSPVIADWKKKNIFKELLENNTSPITLTFIELLIDKGREDLIEAIIAKFHEINDLKQNRVNIEVTSATELTEAIKSKVVTKLTETTSKTIIPTYITDPTVKGGISIRVNDWVYDATLKTQLRLLKENLI
jgi:F-type H+-transporting ATPase subunit delta